MKRWVIILPIATVVLVAGLYILNLFGTATWDPRARLAGYTTFVIRSMSMAPTLLRRDYIFVQTSAYALHPPKNGEIVVFRYPRDRNVSFVLRVAGAPGDKVAINEGKLYINGNAIQESYLLGQSLIEPYSLSMDEITIPQGQVFVLGDNRDDANDSRMWGLLPKDDLIGRVIYIWSADDVNRIGKVH